MLSRCRILRLTKTREEAGTTLANEVMRAKKKIRNDMTTRPVMTSKEREEAGQLLREKRMALLEQGKKIPKELKTSHEKKMEKKLATLVDRGPHVMRQLKEYALSLPERRQTVVQKDFCTQINSARTTLHPIALSRWYDIVKSAPQGMLRHHLRESVPYFDDKMKESMFHKFYDSSDIEILKRKGYVFEGRDGEPLKLTLEELRQAREASIYAKDDARTARNIRYMISKRMEMKSKDLPDSPTFRPLTYGEGDGLAYVAYRTFPIYAVLLRVFGEIALRCPQFLPRSQLDFGSGLGTSIFTAVEVWKGISPHAATTTSEKYANLKFEQGDERAALQHPKHNDVLLRSILSDVVNKEITELERKAAEAERQVSQGLLPSGSEVEVHDAVKERKELLKDSVWNGSQKWKGEETSDGLDEDFLGEGMYSGKTKSFEESDYFLEKDHSDYGIPDEAEKLDKKGIRTDIYLKWFDVREKWAGSYFAHVEKQKMERDPSYRPYSAMQYLVSKSENDQPDRELESSKLHEEDIEDKAIVYNDWEKRDREILSKITAIEPSSAMTNYGLDFLVHAAPHVTWKKFLPDGAGASSTHDLVTCVYTLSEFQSESLRADAIRSLWEHCEGILVIIEAGTPAGFKLVLDARRTILEEYKDVGPWEVQPTVLAPCPHDKLRCPVEYSLQGRRFKALRTCHSVARYEPSFVETWAHSHKTHNEEPYSYCVIARNEVVPKKALRDVPDVEPTVVTENPAKMKTDPRILKVLEDKEERKLWSSDNRRRVPEELYDEDEYMEYPETELNMSPMVGKWKGYGDKLKTKDYLAVHKETEEYIQAFRDRSWGYSRVVRPVAANGTIDVCTPHGTQERFRVQKASSRILKGIQKQGYPGALVPHVSGVGRYEWVQGDMPNTFAQSVETLNPIEAASLERSEKKYRKSERDEARAEDPELSAWEDSLAADIEQARTDPSKADQLRQELREMGVRPGHRFD
eukprot:TRINITY_DN8614_c1_g2_i1.p1 TRINITY_DN8614_c1_g2~~TRINITY_DN8614_c1_g2_i1.p1  ORF type:complete len:977 (+),score=191.36 TRINITY_DN8614_c1_g2_i1:342-3272(+)